MEAIISYIKSIKDYYPTYLSFHKNIWTKRFHLAGEVLTLIFLLETYGFLYVKNYATGFMLLAASPFAVYVFAWPAHLIFEHNRPAAFSHPLRSKVCDLYMCYELIRGRF